MYLKSLISVVHEGNLVTQVEVYQYLYIVFDTLNPTLPTVGNDYCEIFGYKRRVLLYLFKMNYGGPKVITKTHLLRPLSLKTKVRSTRRL